MEILKDTEVEACFQGGKKGMNSSYMSTMYQVLLFTFLLNQFSHLVLIIR